MTRRVDPTVSPIVPALVHPEDGTRWITARQLFGARYYISDKLYSLAHWLSKRRSLALPILGILRRRMLGLLFVLTQVLEFLQLFRGQNGR